MVRDRKIWYDIKQIGGCRKSDIEDCAKDAKMIKASGGKRYEW